MSGISTKCIECGAPLELDPYKNYVKCMYCGSLNFCNNKKYINQGGLLFRKLRDYFPKLKKKKNIYSYSGLLKYIFFSFP